MADTARAALAHATARLSVGSPTARLDSELLMAHAMGMSREALLLGHLDDPVPPAFGDFVDRRLSHEPVAYITGSRAFWTIDLAVGPGALVPRADSETLIEAALDHFGSIGPSAILDLGTGPGTLLLAVLDQWPRATGLGIDRSETALAMARANAIRLGLDDRCTFHCGDWAQGVAQRYDLVLANPPYIATAEHLPQEVVGHEPPEALFAGSDGLDDYRVIIPDIPRLLTPGGIAILEIGHRQADAVGMLGSAAGLAVAVRHDLGGNPRALLLR